MHFSQGRECDTGKTVPCEKSKYRPALELVDEREMALQVRSFRRIDEHLGRHVLVRPVLDERSMEVPWIDCYELYGGHHDV